MSGLQPPKGVVAKTAGFGGKVCVHMCVLQAYSTVFTGHRVVLQCNLLMAGVLHLVTTFISHSHTQLHTHTHTDHCNGKRINSVVVLMRL